MLGDCNFHMPFENRFIYENNFVDFWLEKNQKNPGYTWDPKENSMINVILPLDNRRMRLDRILAKKNNNLFKFSDI
jgi:hypothetical protein